MTHLVYDIIDVDGARPSCPQEVVQLLLADENDLVRENALLNPQCPADYSTLHHSLA